MRKTVVLDENELEAIKRVFFPYGSIARFIGEYNISRGAVDNLLNKGRGLESVVTAVREFVQKQKQNAEA